MLKRTISPVVSFRRDPLDRRYPERSDGQHRPVVGLACAVRTFAVHRARQFVARRCHRERLGRRSRNARTAHPDRSSAAAGRKRGGAGSARRTHRAGASRAAVAAAASVAAAESARIVARESQGAAEPEADSATEHSTGTAADAKYLRAGPVDAASSRAGLDPDRRTDCGRRQSSADPGPSPAPTARASAAPSPKPPAPTAAPTSKPATPAPVAPSASPTAAAVAVHASSAPIASPAPAAHASLPPAPRSGVPSPSPTNAAAVSKTPGTAPSPGPKGLGSPGPVRRRRTAEGRSIASDRDSADAPARGRQRAQSATPAPPNINDKLRGLLPNNPVVPTTKQLRAGHARCTDHLEPTPPPEVLAQTKYHVQIARRGSEGRVVMWVTATHKSGPTTVCTGWLVRYPFNATPPGGFAPANGTQISIGGASHPGSTAADRRGHGHQPCEGRLLVPYAGSTAPSP